MSLPRFISSRMAPRANTMVARVWAVMTAAYTSANRGRPARVRCSMKLSMAYRWNRGRAMSTAAQNRLNASTSSRVFL